MDNQALNKVVAELREQRAAITHAIDVLAPVVEQKPVHEHNIHLMPRRRKKFHQSAEARARIRRSTLRRWKAAREAGRNSLAA